MGRQGFVLCGKLNSFTLGFASKIVALFERASRDVLTAELNNAGSCKITPIVRPGSLDIPSYAIRRKKMRSDLVFEAVHTLRNRYMLCQLASKATRKFHRAQHPYPGYDQPGAASHR